ncbi:MAG: VOC family protein [Bacteroidota bacterium]
MSEEKKTKFELLKDDLPLYQALEQADTKYIPGNSQSFVEPIVKAYDLAYVRFSCPDLDMMEDFVKDFGLIVTHRDEEVLYSRGLAPMPYCHVVHKGPAKFLGFGLLMKSEEDLHKLAKELPGCSPVYDIGGLEGELGGGGKRVHYVDNISGFLIEAVHGLSAEELKPKRAKLKYNYAGEYIREGELMDAVGNRENNSADPGPPEIRRIAHCVLCLPIGPHQEMMKFMHDTFGFIPSDTAYVDAKPEGHDVSNALFDALNACESNAMAQFMRCDRGEEYTDHHTFFVLPLLDPRAAPPGEGIHAQMSHVAFEVQSLDDVWRGHMSLKRRQDKGKRYSLAWGVGRHVLGSQVYDYWYDPWGHVHEHMVDGDRLTKSWGQRIHNLNHLGPNGHNQWGPTVPESGIRNLDGPQTAPYYSEIPEDTQHSLINRDLSDVQHILDGLRQ